MPVLPNDFLAIAENKKTVTDEMQLRNSISRAYYAAYLHARDKVKDAKIDISSCRYGGVHQQLIDSFKKGLCDSLFHGIELHTQEEVAGLLSLGKQLRVKADYKLTANMNESDKYTVISVAKKIIEILRD